MRHRLFAGAALACALGLGAPAFAQTATVIQETYSALHPTENRATVAILGDGFQAGEQGAFNDYVEDVVMRGFRSDAFGEDLGAFRIVRINLNSADSGVTRVDSNGDVTTARNTALDWRYSGSWSRCWMEPGPQNNARTAAALAAAGVSPDYTFHVLNVSSGGGCRRGSSLAVTTQSSWTTVAHELGHMVGSLCDEYDAVGRDYTGGEPGCVNMTVDIGRNTLKWRDWVRAATPLPTASGDATGAFEGGHARFATGIWRPTRQSRMRNNWPDFNAPSYHRLMDVMRGYSRSNFGRAHVGDFDGDGAADVAFPRRNAIRVFRSDGANMAPYASVVDRVSGPGGTARIGWDARLTVGDFDGDGMDDIAAYDWRGRRLVVLRSTGSGFEVMARYNGSLMDRRKPFHARDRIIALDYNGDGRTDLAVSNTTGFAQPVFVMYRATGTGFARTAGYRGSLPGWQMAAADRYMVGDFSGDGRDDIFVFNRANWSKGYLGMLRSTGAGLAMSRRYDGSLPLWSEMRRHDRFYVGDWDGNGRDDIAVFNSRDWCCRYLSLHLSTGAGLVGGRRYENDLPGWQMQTADRFYVADINGDGRDDLYVYNARDWDKEYLGSMRSTGGGALSGGWQKDWIGSWNLGASDLFLVGDFGAAGREDLFVRNAGWFGMLASTGTRVNEVSIHRHYLKDYDHHKWDWW